MKDQSQALETTRDQLAILQREYKFYKDLADKLQFRQTGELEILEKQNKRYIETDKDSKL